MTGRGQLRRSFNAVVFCFLCLYFQLPHNGAPVRVSQTYRKVPLAGPFAWGCGLSFRSSRLDIWTALCPYHFTPAREVRRLQLYTVAVAFAKDRNFYFSPRSRHLPFLYAVVVYIKIGVALLMLIAKSGGYIFITSCGANSGRHNDSVIVVAVYISSFKNPVVPVTVRPKVPLLCQVYSAFGGGFQMEYILLFLIFRHWYRASAMPHIRESTGTRSGIWDAIMRHTFSTVTSLSSWVTLAPNRANSSAFLVALHYGNPLQLPFTVTLPLTAPSTIKKPPVTSHRLYRRKSYMIDRL